MIHVSDVISTESNSELLTNLSNSYSIDIQVSKNDIDGFGHVNNANYVQWLDQVHWYHLHFMGIKDSDVTEVNCGFVVYNSDLTYLAPLFENDRVRVGTEITYFDKRFRLTRRFQLVRVRDNVTVLKAQISTFRLI